MATTILSPQQLPGALGEVAIPEPACLVGPDGQPSPSPGLEMPPDAEVLELYRHCVRVRRFERQATALTRQGRLAVYPNAAGQEACQVGATLALREEDWLFPTYRDTAALVTRGIPPEEALSLLRGEWHCGYDPRRWRTAPQCTPLATHVLHAVGLAFAARLRQESVAVLAFIGDGATSEGDASEALNFAAIWGAPVVFFVQNNQYAISVPLSKQTRSPTLAHRALGFGVPAYRVDGNDTVAVREIVRRLLDAAREGGGPSLVEGITYRLEAHTNADDDRRYRNVEEAKAWRERDPIARLDAYLAGRGALDDAGRKAAEDDAERLAAGMREALGRDIEADPAWLFAHVYGRPTRLLEAEEQSLAEELRLAASEDAP
jgi:2-oxoisovalerate dehydrogenase E1 component alpha subunit